MLQDVCQIALIAKGTFYTQQIACKAFITLIELFKDDLELIETVNKFVMAFRTHNINGELYNLN